MNFTNLQGSETKGGVSNYIQSYDKPFKWKGVALWLIENTAISFKQIAAFCGLHTLEVEALANEETGESIVPNDPILMHLLDRETIELCSNDHSRQLTLPSYNALSMKLASQQSKARYTTLAKKKDKPDAIAWLLKAHPYISDNQIIKLVGTTKNTINSIRDKTYKLMKNVKLRSPVALGLCTAEQLDNTVMCAKVSYDRMRIDNDSDDTLFDDVAVKNENSDMQSV